MTSALHLVTIHTFFWMKFMRKLSILHPFSFFYGFSIKMKTLSCTHISPMPQLQAKELMMSQSFLCIEYLVPTYSTLLLLLQKM